MNRGVDVDVVVVVVAEVSLKSVLIPVNLGVAAIVDVEGTLNNVRIPLKLGVLAGTGIATTGRDTGVVGNLALQGEIGVGVAMTETAITDSRCGGGAGIDDRRTDFVAAILAEDVDGARRSDFGATGREDGVAVVDTSRSF